MVLYQVRTCRRFHAIGFHYQKLAWSPHSWAERCAFWPQFILQLASFSETASDGMLCHEESSTGYAFKHQGASFSNALWDRSWYDDQISATHTLKYQHDINEKYVLSELSDLLPVPSAVNLFADESAPKLVDEIAVDGFLSPEEKLRGVFLQNLKGKAAVEQALADTRVNVNLDVISRVVNKWNLGGEAMVIFFRWAIKQPTISNNNTECYNVIIKALGRRKFFGFMMDMMDEMRSNGTRGGSLETLSIILDSFIRARRVKKAIEVFERSEEYGLEYSTESLNVLLQCLCQRSHVVAASRLLNSVKGKVAANASTYNIIISGWSKFGNVGEIKRYLEEMKKIEGFSPDCWTMSYLIEGLGRCGQLDESVLVFESMKERDVAVYNAVIANFGVVRDFEQCKKYHSRMLIDKCDPNLDTYNTIISSYLKSRKVADALEMFDEMISRGVIPSTSTVTSYIERLCSYGGGPPYAAMMIYKKAKKAGVSISLTGYKLLFTRLSRLGKCGMMLSLWDEMQESGHSSDMEVYEHIINGLCNIGQLDNAVLVMEESLQKGFCPGRLIWSKLNNKLMDSSYNNNVGKAYKLFLKVKAARRSENARRYWRSTGWHF